MADAVQRVGIEIDIDAGSVAARIKAIEKQLKAMEKTVARMDKKGSGINDTFKKLDKRMGRVGQAVKGVTGLFTKLFTTLAKFSFLAMAGEIAIFTAGLLAVKLALITGRAAASLYNITLKGLSVTAAAVGVALSTAAAAMRQFQEAQLSPFLGGGLTGRAAVGRMGRGIGATTAGLLGGEGTQQVVGALARAGFREGTASSLAQNLGALTNFDPKAMAQIISALGAAGRGGGMAPAISAVTGAVGFRQGTTVSASNMNALVGMINSGQLTNPAFANQGAQLGSSFIGTAKTSFVGIKDMFADAGVELLEPMRQAFLGIAQSLRENFLALNNIIQKFGADSMGPTMVTIFDRMMRFITENIIDHLDNIKEMGENFMGFFRGIKNFFGAMGDFLGRFEPAANVVIDMFKAASNANKSSLFRDFSEGLTANADKIKEFGAGLGRLFGGVFSMFEAGNRGFFGGLESITNVMDAITEKAIPAIQNFMAATAPVFEKLPEIIGGLSEVLNMVAPAIELLAKMIAGLISALSSVGGGAGSGLLGMAAMGAMFGKKGGFKGGFGKIRGAVAGSSMGQAIKRSGFYKNVLGGKLPSAGLVATGLGGAFLGTSGVLGAFKEGGGASNVMSGALGGAMLGGAIGTMVPIPGMTLVGAGAGALIGGVAAFGAGLIGKNKKQKASQQLLNSLLLTDMFQSGPNSQFSTRSAKFSHDQRLLELYNDAVSTGGFDGDTEAAARFMRAMGITDLDGIHRDDFMEGLRDQGFGDSLTKGIQEMKNIELRNETEMLKRVNASLKKFGDGLEVTGQDVQGFVEGLGLNLMDASQSQLRAAGVMMAADRLNFTRNRAVIPDIGNSGLAVGETFASANSALSSIINGDMTSANITDFLTKQAQVEIAMGNSADVAGLSGILELRAQAEAGRFGPAGSAKHKSIMNVIETGQKNFFRDLSGQTMIGQSVLEEQFAKGGLGGLDNFVGQIQQNRAAISGTGGMKFNERILKLKDLGFKMDIDTFRKFRESTGLNIDFMGGEDLSKRLIDAAREKGTDEETLSNALSQAFIDSGLSNDGMERITQAIEGLQENVQKISINMNDGADGGDKSITVRSSSGEFAYLNLGERQFKNESFGQ